MAVKRSWDTEGLAREIAKIRAEHGFPRGAGTSTSTVPTASQTPVHFWTGAETDEPLPSVGRAEEGPSFWGGFFDFIDRPRAAIANVIKDSLDPDPNTDNILESIGAGLLGYDHTSFADVLTEVEENSDLEFSSGVKGVGGFIGDVALDPLSYLPIPGAKWALKKAGEKVFKGNLAQKSVDEVPESLTTREEAIAAATAPPQSSTVGGVGITPPQYTGTAGLPKAPLELTSGPVGRVEAVTTDKRFNAGHRQGAMGTPGEQIPLFPGDEFNVPRKLAGKKPPHGRGSRRTKPYSKGPQGPEEYQPGLFGAGLARDINDINNLDLPPQIRRYLSEVRQGNPDLNALGFPTGNRNKAQVAQTEIERLREGLVREPGEKAANDIAARAVASEPIPVTPPVGTATAITPEQNAARTLADQLAQQKGVTSAEARQQWATDNARQHGTTPEQEYTEMFGKDAHAPAVSTPVTPGAHPEAAAASNAVASSGRQIVDEARAYPDKLNPKDVFQNQPKHVPLDPDKVDLEYQYRKVWYTTAGADKAAKEAGLEGASGQAAKMAHVIDDLAQDFDRQVARGKYPYIQYDQYGGNKKYNLHAVDMYEAVGTKGTVRLQFSPRSVPPSSQLLGAAAAIATHIGVMAGNLTEAQAKQIIAMAMMVPPKMGQKASARTLKEVSDVMWEARERLYAAHLKNKEMFAKRDLAVGNVVGNDVADRVTATLKDPSTGMGTKAAAISGAEDAIRQGVDARGGGPAAAPAATQAAAQKASQYLSPGSVETANVITQNAKRMASGDGKAAAKANQQLADDQLDVLRAQGAEQGLNISEQAGFEASGIMRKIINAFGTKFNQGYGQGIFAALGRAAFNRFTNNAHQYGLTISKIAKEHSKTDIKTAWEAIRNDFGKSGLTAEEAAAYDALEDAMENVLARSKGVNSWGDTVMSRNTNDIDLMNRLLEDVKAKTRFRAKKEGSDLETPETWREIDIDDPLDELSKIHSAQMNLASWATVGRTFVNRYASKVAKPGHSKVARSDLDKDGVDISHFLDPDMYYPDEYIRHIARFSKEMKANITFANKFMVQLMDPAIATLKISQTIVRPGHLMRNLFGDWLMNGSDGIWNMRNYTKAAQVLNKTGGWTSKSSGKGFQELRDALSDVIPEPKGPTITTVTLKGGKKVNLSANQISYLAGKYGLFQSYKQVEDILGTAEGGLNKPLNWLNKTGPIKLGGKISENSSNWMRLSHVLGRIEKDAGKYDNLDSLFQATVGKVQQYHPDIKGLTSFEQKYMRRGVLYYNWFRQSMPMVAQTMLTKPGRMTWIPKAMYNAQIAMGGDPDSMMDPFPVDRLYPDFVRDSLFGPWSTDESDSGVVPSLGSPIESLADIGTNPSATLLGMINPYLRAPVEMMTGSYLGDPEHPVSDRSDYVDQLIPFFNQIANISGYSPSGILGGGTEETLWEQQHTVEGGNKTPFPNYNIAGVLGPVGLMNTNRSDYVNIARSQAAKQAKQNDPFAVAQQIGWNNWVGQP